ncbi:MAG: GPP34 family phosphoprotein [Nonomuraea sp.]|nr:GPP34 family phosphoprotein [Nonomuraea sp.]NUT42633.1 GPP34 family phosphoprotein [Thermoactinospora sp.]
MLADDFFFVSWDTTGSGKPRLHVQGVALGLAGALIAELVLERRITVEGVRLRIADRRQVQDEVTGKVLTEIDNSPQHTDVRTWLAYLAQRSVTEVTGRLMRTGLLERESPKLLKRKQFRYFCHDFNRAMWPAARLRLALVRWQPLTPHDMALAALADACDLTDVVVEDPADRRGAHQYLTTLLAAMPQPLSDLSRQVGAAVGDAVLTYRT